MDNSLKTMSRRERRRKQNQEKSESENIKDVVIYQNKFVEKNSQADDKDSRILVRRKTFTVLKPRTIFENISSDEKVDGHETKDVGSSGEDELNIVPHNNVQSDSEDSKNQTHTINDETWNTDSKNLTYNIQNGENVSKHDTYNVQNSDSDQQRSRPVPAPRRRQTIMAKEPDKNSSDTDKDVMDIEIDEANISNGTESLEREPDPVTKISVFESDSSVEAPKPKPRKLSSTSVAILKTESISKSKSLEEITVKILSPRRINSDPETKYEDYKKPTTEESKPKSSSIPSKGSRKTRRFTSLLQRRKEKKGSKMFSTMMRFEKARIPTISSILKDMKEDPSKTKLEEEEEDKIDFGIESPRIPQSAPNDKMYVQYKNGFYLTKKDEVFKKDEDFQKGESGRIEDSVTSTMLQTAMLFQKYWSRSMIYFHGILAGLGFGHAFAITAVLLYFNQETQGFIDVYACLALKIHFMFYTLTALCMISCLDRLDVGNMSKKHWGYICSKCPTLWFILIIYVTSFLLTFSNHSTESRFDSHQYKNVTKERLWDPEVYSNVPDIFTSWYRIIWARDVMVLAAWLLISLTEYPDNLYDYVKDLTGKIEADKANGRNEITTLS